MGKLGQLLIPSSGHTVRDIVYKNLTCRGSACGAVGRAVASNSSDPGSNIVIATFLLSTLLNKVY